MPKAKGKKRPRFDGGHKSRRVTRHRSATLGGGRPEGLRLHHTPGDGNCLFRAFRDALRCEDEDSKEDDDCHTLRAHAVDYMRKNRDLFSAFLDEEEGEFDTYLERMSSDGAWGGHLELHALAALHGVSVVVYQVEDNTCWMIEQSSVKMIVLVFEGRSHYSSVKWPSAEARSLFLSRCLEALSTSRSPPATPLKPRRHRRSRGSAAGRLESARGRLEGLADDLSGLKIVAI